jgi:hypothetical protein
MKRTLVGCLAASVVLLASGAAFSGNSAYQAQVLDFDQTLQELWASWNNLPPSSFQNTAGTQYLPSSVNPNQWPPGPCRWIAYNWDGTVAIDQITHQKSTLVFESLMVLQGRYQCNATVVGDGGSPQKLLSIAPRP